MALAVSPRRGQIVRVQLDPARGSEQAGERPALVISPDAVNRVSPVIIVAPLTSRRTSRVHRFEALVEPPEGEVPMRSRVLLLQIRSVDKQRVVGAYGLVGDAVMARVEEALRIVTGLRPV